MAYQSVFKRYEIKFKLSRIQAEKLKMLMSGYMTGDKYGNSTVCNVYLDTPDYLLIRRSIEKPIYKEKLRIRSYGVAKEGAEVFFELKKKYRSVVYKRRLSMTEKSVADCFTYGLRLPDTQIGREISFCFDRYTGLAPKVFISYEREAFYARDNGDLRITFDKNILWRSYDLSLSKGIYGEDILENGEVLLEVKTADSIPLWLVRFLSENKIYKTSFSKYGTAYAAITEQRIRGGILSA